MQIASAIDHDHILFSSGIAPDGTCCVRWQQGQYHGYWQAEKATNYATALLMVAGISLAESTILEAIIHTQDLQPGTEAYKIKQSQIMHMIRSTRLEIHPQLNPIFDYHAQEPLVEIGWYKTARTVSMPEAMEEAQIILEGANAAVADGLLSRSMTAAGIKDKLQEKVFKIMRESRS